MKKLVAAAALCFASAAFAQLVPVLVSQSVSGNLRICEYSSGYVMVIPASSRCPYASPRGQ